MNLRDEGRLDAYGKVLDWLRRKPIDDVIAMVAREQGRLAEEAKKQYEAARKRLEAGA